MAAYLFTNLDRAPLILISLSLILMSGFAVTRLSKALRLPNVSGFIIAGVLIGPHVLGLVSADMVAAMDFVSDIALAFIAFGVGRYFRRQALARGGLGVITITLLESLTAGVAITLLMGLVFRTGWSFALLLGAIATATAPASTVMTIRQYDARGPFVNTLLQVVALDDVVALLAFGVASAACQAAADGAAGPGAALRPLLFNLIGVLLGAGGGLLLRRLLSEKRSRDNRLILTVAALLGISGICALLDISPLLACMVLGAVYINATGDDGLFDQVDGFSPPVLSFFFILSGMRLDLGALSTAGIMGVAYFLVRIGGKYLGAWLGCKACGTAAETRRWLGVALIPQAGVSIGLAVLGGRILPPEMGELLSTVILSSSILYELVGPACAKLSLFRSGAIEAETPQSRKQAVAGK